MVMAVLCLDPKQLSQTELGQVSKSLVERACEDYAYYDVAAFLCGYICKVIFTFTFYTELSVWCKSCVWSLILCLVRWRNNLAGALGHSMIGGPYTH